MSATLTVADNGPDDAGLKLTEIRHEPPTATLVPQLLVCENELAFVPVIETPEMVRALLPVLLSWMLCDAAVAPTEVLGKVRLPGARLTVVGCPPPPLTTAWMPSVWMYLPVESAPVTSTL